MKRLFTLLATVFSISLYAQYPTDGLVAYYPFDGNANDVSGNGYHLTPTNGSIPAGVQYSDDNENQANSALRILSNAQLVNTSTSLMPTGSYTIAYWVKLVAPYAQYPTAVELFENIYCRFYSPTATAQIGQYNTSSQWFQSEGLSNQMGNWHHVAVVFDDANNDADIYFDGSLSQTLTGITFTPVALYNVGLNVGGGTNSGVQNNNKRLNGLMDDLFIYHRALTLSEIGTLLDPEACTAEFTSTLQDASVCDGGQLSLTATVNNTTGVTYQWKKGGSSITDGGSISGATTNNLVIDPFTSADAGEYSLEATNLCGTSVSNSAEISMDEPIVISTSITGSTEQCLGNISTYAIYGVTGADIYNWTLPNGMAVFGFPTGQEHSIQFNSTNGGTIEVSASNQCGTSNTVTIDVTVYDIPPVPVITQNGSILETNAGADYYEWYSGNDLVQSSASNTYSPTADGDYYVVYYDINGCVSGSSVYTYSTVGIMKTDNYHFSIYPNPTRNILTIETAEVGNFVLTNIVGEALYAQQIQNKAVISLEQFAAGIYFLTEVNSGKTVKVVKE